MAGGGSENQSIFPGAYVLDIEKRYQAEYFTNRYILQTADIAAAVTAAQQIKEVERAIHRSQVLFTRMRVSDADPTTDVYQIFNLNQFGLVSGHPETTYLPLFNVMRVDFNTVGGGRPSRKYYRLPIAEPDIENGVFVSSVLNQYQGLIDPLLAINAFVDVDGQEFSTCSIYPFVQMRQLRRGSKRKTTTTNPPGTPV